MFEQRAIWTSLDCTSFESELGFAGIDISEVIEASFGVRLEDVATGPTTVGVFVFVAVHSSRYYLPRSNANDDLKSCGSRFPIGRRVPKIDQSYPIRKRNLKNVFSVSSLSQSRIHHDLHGYFRCLLAREVTVLRTIERGSDTREQVAPALNRTEKIPWKNKKPRRPRQNRQTVEI